MAVVTGALAQKPASAGKEALATRLALALVIVGYLALGLYYNVTNPIWEAPDEPAHYRYVLHLIKTHTLPIRTTSVGDQYHQPPLYYFVGALAVSWLPLDEAAPAKYNPLFIWREPRLGDEPNVALHTQDELPPYTGTVLALHLLRFLSLLFGAVAVWVAYALARTILPDRPWLAVAAAGLTAFTPQFLFVGATAGNDGPAIALSSLTLLTATRMALAAREGRTISWRSSALLGLWLGLGLLSKLTFLGIVPLVVLLALYTLVIARRRLRTFAGWAASAGIGVVLGGWWYFRNLLIYASSYALFGPGLMDERTITLREFQEKPAEVATIFGWYPEPLFQSFWLRFGWMDIYPDGWVYDAAKWLCLIALAGCLLFVLRWLLRRQRPASPALFGAVICTLAFLSTLSVVTWRFAYTLGNHYPQGRYLFGAQPAIALLLVLGLAEVAGLPPAAVGLVAGSSRIWLALRRGLAVAAALALVALASALCVAAANRYITPSYSTLPVWLHWDDRLLDNKVDANYDNKLALIGYDLVQRDVTAGGTVTIDLYWRASDKMDQDLHAFVHIADDTGKPLAQKDAPAGGEVYPTTQWARGEVIRERRVIAVDSQVPAGTYQVLVGVYSYQTMQRLPLVSPQGATAVRLTTLTVRAPAVAAGDGAGLAQVPAGSP